MVGVLFRKALAWFLGSQTALIGAGLFFGLTAALTWHYVDKAAAVRSAKKALADKTTIATQKAIIDEANRRLNVANKNIVFLERKTALAERDVLNATKELEAYEGSTQVNNKCVVDATVLERLHNR